MTLPTGAHADDERKLMADGRKPKVLFVYYTFTKQALKVTEDMESVFRDRGFEIERAQIEFTDPRYTKRFAVFPFKHRYLDIIALLPAQLRRATGEIAIGEIYPWMGFRVGVIGNLK